MPIQTLKRLRAWLHRASTVEWSPISEEQPGFQQMIEATQHLFPGVMGWEEQVIQLAFARNEIELFQA